MTADVLILDAWNPVGHLQKIGAGEKNKIQLLKIFWLKFFIYKKIKNKLFKNKQKTTHPIVVWLLNVFWHPYDHKNKILKTWV